MIQGNQSDLIGPGVGYVERFAVAAARHAGHHAFLRRIGGGYFVMTGQRARGKGELVHELRFAAAGEEAFSLGIEAEAVETLRDLRSGRNLPGLEIDDHDFVLAVAAVHHGREWLMGMEDYVHGEIAHNSLRSGGFERPLHGQQGLSARLRAGQFRRGFRLRRIVAIIAASIGMPQQIQAQKAQDNACGMENRCFSSHVWLQIFDCRPFSFPDPPFSLPYTLVQMVQHLQPNRVSFS